MNDIFTYVQTLTPISMDRLYKDVWACQAIFQSLPALAKQFIFRLLCIDAPFELEKLKQWLSPQGLPAFENSVDKLKTLRVIQPLPGERTWRIHPSMKENLKRAIGGGLSPPWEEGRKSLKPDNKSPTAEFLDSYARDQWDTVLHYMVGSTEARDPSREVVDLLLRTNLMRYSSSDKNSIHITDVGYEFILKDIHIQIWTFIVEYMNTCHLKSIGPDEVLRFLFQLSHCKMHEYYPIADLSPGEQKILRDFTNFGLLYQRKSSSRRFYTTRLSVNLIFGGDAIAAVAFAAPGRNLTATNPIGNLELVVETNFKVYAYTSSPLHLSMLSLFVDIVMRLPNLVVGFITRESLQYALSHGISARQITTFLSKHAHPRMKSRKPLIPENITDQIYLWERERQRISYTSAVLVSSFSTIDEFEETEKYAQDLGVCLWSSKETLKIAIATEAYEKIQSFLRTLR